LACDRIGASIVDKIFDAITAQARLSERWEKERTFWPGTDPARPQTFLIPPPNITGALHMGHALNAILMDILARVSRLQGYDVLLQTGFDHAGESLERLVKVELAEKGISLFDLEREELVEEVWRWKARYEPLINHQLERLGISSPRSRQPFTLDGSFRTAVYTGFEALYRDGLISHRETLLDWCCRCAGAVTDPEPMDVDGSLWQVMLEIIPLQGEEKKFIAVTTATPEALCCIAAVAVHPDDERYSDLIGRPVRVPLDDTEVPVVASSAMDPHFGSGAVPLSPGFDQGHFVVGCECDIVPRPLVGSDGRLVDRTGRYAGLEILDARTKIIHDLEQEGLVQSIRSHPRSVGHCPRCASTLVPLLTRRWVLSMEEDAAAVAEKIRDIRIEPERWKSVLVSALQNSRPMLISRKSWWGIPVPAFYCSQCGATTVAQENPRACPSCGGTRLRAEQDVLDTWFTVAFWPMAIFHWPKGGEALNLHYPCHTLATDRGIVRSWILKMLLIAHRLTGELPFKQLLVHGTVVDDAGRKMSKSQKNGIDPLDLLSEVGTDAFRFALALMASDDGDISISQGKLALGHHFVAKVWNVARFTLKHLPQYRPVDISEASLAIEDQWILRKMTRLTDAWGRGVRDLRLSDVATELYEFVWHALSDWYVEAARSRLAAGGEDGALCLAVLVNVLRRLLSLLHPFTPFLCTEVWERFAAAEAPGLSWEGKIDRTMIPPLDVGLDEGVERTMATLQEVVSAVRTVRAQNRIPLERPLSFVVQPPDAGQADMLRARRGFLRTLARGANVEVEHDARRPQGYTVSLFDVGSVFVELPDNVDIAAELDRVTRAKHSVEERFLFVTRRLESLDFIRNAPPEVVDKMKRLKKNISRQITNLCDVEEELRARVPEPLATTS
jgi:valyl-tRNA synthetase